MKFTRQTAPVSRIRKNLRDQHLIPGNGLTILPAPRGAGISTGQERGPARSTYRALAEGISECSSLANQTIQPGSQGELVSQGLNRVKTLLVGANP